MYVAQLLWRGSYNDKIIKISQLKTHLRIIDKLVLIKPYKY